MSIDTRPKPFVFVLMPLSRDFDDVYRLGILPACDAAGAYGERVDEQIFDESILRRIYNQIAKADLIVSDMSGRNPNVFYETGYAHALGKTVILLTRDVNDIPFDLKHYPHIVYGGRLVDLVEELERRVRFFANKSASSVAQVSPIDVHVNEVPITSGSVRIPVAKASASLGIDLKIDIRNSIARQIRTIACQIGLLSPRVFVKAYAEGGLSLPRAVEDDRLLHYSPKLEQLLPGAWRAIKIRSAAEGNRLDQRVYSFAVRVFTEVGPTDHPFELELEE